MRRHLTFLAAVVVMLSLLGGCKSPKAGPVGNAGPASTQPDAAVALTYSGPYQHKNLTVFLVHGPNRLAEGEFLTLSEALEQTKIVVHETGQVSELAVENVGKVPIYIHSGDIVRGGQQDRVLPNDVVLKPNSGKVPVSSLCVEQGRWQQRGAEDVATFNSSANSFTGNAMKLAARDSQNQSGVWNEVAKVQQKLQTNAGSVPSAASPSSLELALSDKKVQEAIDEYVKQLSDLTKGRKDAIGLVVAVNGKIQSVDTYGNATLFGKFWPKLIKSAATEAVAEFQKDLKLDPVAKADVAKYVADAERGRLEQRKADNDQIMIYNTNGGSVRFQTQLGISTRPEETVHSTIITKEK